MNSVHIGWQNPKGLGSRWKTEKNVVFIGVGLIWLSLVVS